MAYARTPQQTLQDSDDEDPLARSVSLWATTFMTDPRMDEDEGSITRLAVVSSTAGQAAPPVRAQVLLDPRAPSGPSAAGSGQYSYLAGPRAASSLGEPSGGAVADTHEGGSDVALWAPFNEQLRVPVLPDAHKPEPDVPDTAPPGFTRSGISMAGLQAFIERVGGRQALHCCSTGCVASVVADLTKPADESERYLSYIDRHLPHMKAATVFVSHARSYKFLWLVDALQEWLDADEDEVDADKTYFWIDVFCTAQHAPADKPAYWMDIFRHHIQATGKTLLVLDGETFAPLSRTWCIWELACTLTARKGAQAHGGVLEIVMPTTSQQLLYTSLMHKPYELVQRICAVDVSQSTAYHNDQCELKYAAGICEQVQHKKLTHCPKDGQAIASAIAADTIGLENLNLLVRRYLFELLARLGEDRLNKLLTTEGKELTEGSKLSVGFGALLLHLGQGSADAGERTELLERAVGRLRACYTARLAEGAEHDAKTDPDYIRCALHLSQGLVLIGSSDAVAEAGSVLERVVELLQRGRATQLSVAAVHHTYGLYLASTAVRQLAKAQWHSQIALDMYGCEGPLASVGLDRKLQLAAVDTGLDKLEVDLRLSRGEAPAASLADRAQALLAAVYRLEVGLTPLVLKAELLCIEAGSGSGRRLVRRCHDIFGMHHPITALALQRVQKGRAPTA